MSDLYKCADDDDDGGGDGVTLLYDMEDTTFSLVHLFDWLPFEQDKDDLILYDQINLQPFQVNKDSQDIQIFLLLLVQASFQLHLERYLK